MNLLKLFSLLLISMHFSFSFAESLLTTISAKNALLYENPSTTSPIVRRVLDGEVVKIIETIKTEKGDTWGKVYLTPTQVAYLPGQYFVNSGALEQKIWRPVEVIRTEKPFSFAAKGTSELFGPGLEFRYLPFTRLGVTIGAGSVLDDNRSKGYSVAYGLTCLLSTGNLSPFIETGVSTLTFADGQSNLRISSFYINAGVEWIIRSGYFIGVGISYNRSYNVQVSYDYSYAKASNGNVKLGNYGSFGNLDGAESLQRINPLFLLGYAF